MLRPNIRQLWRSINKHCHYNEDPLYFHGHMTEVLQVAQVHIMIYGRRLAGVAVIFIDIQWVLLVFYVSTETQAVLLVLKDFYLYMTEVLPA